jgi:hypothetical protein
VLPDPEIPYVHGRDLVPIRLQPTKYQNDRHERLFAREDAVRKRIKLLDQAVLDLAAERRELLHEIRAIHAELRPSYDGARGRRRRAIPHEEALPPAADNAVHLIGRALRAVCVTLLREAQRPLTLRELHVVLHRLGYLVAHDHPVKALADALGHEADAGRAIRTARATYRAAGQPGPGQPGQPGPRARAARETPTPREATSGGASPGEPGGNARGIPAPPPPAPSGTGSTAPHQGRGDHAGIVGRDHAAEPESQVGPSNAGAGRDEVDHGASGDEAGAGKPGNHPAGGEDDYGALPDW